MKSRLLCHIDSELENDIRKEAKSEDRKISAVVERALRAYFGKTRGA